MGLPEKLDALTHKAVRTLDGVMDEYDSDPDHVSLQRLRSDAAKAVLVTRQRADEAVFRIRQNDRLAELLEAVLRRKAELASAPGNPPHPPESQYDD